MTEANAALARLISLTDSKIKQLRAILDITNRQKEAIAQENIDLLTEYIKEKQQHIDVVNGLDKEFEEIYDNIRDRLQGNGALNGELRDKIQEVQDILRNIYDIEQQNNASVKQIMEDLKSKIRDVSSAKKGYNAYKSTPTMADGVFIDKKR